MIFSLFAYIFVETFNAYPLLGLTVHCFCSSARAISRLGNKKATSRAELCSDRMSIRREILSYFSWDIIETHLKTWFVHTMTDCWLESWLSRTWRTKCIQMKSPVFCCNRVRKMQDRSCSDWVTVNEKKWQFQQSSSQHCGADRLLTQLVLHLSLFDIIPVNQLIPRASIQLVFRVLQMKFPADFRVNKREREEERRRMILNKIQWVIRSRDISSKQRDTHAYGLHAVEREISSRGNIYEYRISWRRE